MGLLGVLELFYYFKSTTLRRAGGLQSQIPPCVSHQPRFNIPLHFMFQVLLELLTSMSVFDQDRDPQGLDTYIVEMCEDDPKLIFEYVDTSAGKWSEDSVTAIYNLAESSLNYSRKKRPTMAKVSQHLLSSIVGVLLVTAIPPRHLFLFNSSSVSLTAALQDRFYYLTIVEEQF